jgi:serine/threonine protein kinase/regulation of enolase protein 1 (concanavalin A-like superfamily)
MDELIGQQFGNYRLLRCLGHGGFADVYIGEHIYLGTYVAIKILHIRLLDRSRDAFFNEARTLAQLNHPAIVRILDFGLRDTTPYLIMDYAPNGTLRQRFLKGRPLAPETLFPFIGQIAAALQYAHDHKFIHRDIKPENILLSSSNTLLLSDFGLVLSAQSTNLRSLQEVAGTASYMAPEQLRGKPLPASDQYSLGIVVYEWLTGSCPFQGTFFEIASQHMFVEPPPLREKVPNIPPQIEDVVLTALAKDAKQRFASVQIFVKALLNACQSSQQQAPPYTHSAHKTGNDTIGGIYLKSSVPPTEEAQGSAPQLPMTPFPLLEDVKPLRPDMNIAPSPGQDAHLLPVTPFPPVNEETRIFVGTPDSISSPPVHITEQKDTPVQANFVPPPLAQPVTRPPHATAKPRSKKMAVLFTALIVLLLIGSVSALYLSTRNWSLTGAGLNTHQATHVLTHVTPYPVCANTFKDQFNEPALNSTWLWDAGNMGMYKQTNQGLAMTSPPGTDLRAWNMAAPRVLRPLSGNFTVSVLTTFMPMKSYQGAGIVLWQDEKNFIRLEHGYAHANGVTYEYSLKGKYIRIADTFRDNNPARLLPGVTSVELRLQRHGNTFSAWMRQSGNNWQHINDSQIPFSANLTVGLLVVNTPPTSSPITATFSNFQMSC